MQQVYIHSVPERDNGSRRPYLMHVHLSITVSSQNPKATAFSPRATRLPSLLKGVLVTCGAAWTDSWLPAAEIVETGGAVLVARLRRTAVDPAGAAALASEPLALADLVAVNAGFRECLVLVELVRDPEFARVPFAAAGIAG